MVVAAGPRSAGGGRAADGRRRHGPGVDPGGLDARGGRRSVEHGAAGHGRRAGGRGGGSSRRLPARRGCPCRRPRRRGRRSDAGGPPRRRRPGLEAGRRPARLRPAGRRGRARGGRLRSSRGGAACSVAGFAARPQHRHGRAARPAAQRRAGHRGGHRRPPGRATGRSGRSRPCSRCGASVLSASTSCGRWCGCDACGGCDVWGGCDGAGQSRLPPSTTATTASASSTPHHIAPARSRYSRHQSRQVATAARVARCPATAPTTSHTAVLVDTASM